ncbi:MAG: ferritin-like domain-containing protein [Chloroflexota bacterium]|nr:ferritin-like domain-containing protein [Chloroflexota bacterium]
MPLNSMQDLMIHKLQDIYDAENQALQAYPQIAGTVSSQELKQALQTHEQQTQGQVQRLEQIFQQLGAQPGGQTCHGMQGLIQESQKIIQEGGAPEVLDAAIIAAAQAMEHYEIAGYGTARTLAQQAGMTEAAQLLEQTLEEEKQTDALLTRLAEQNVNQKAQQAGQ